MVACLHGLGCGIASVSTCASSFPCHWKTNQACGFRQVVLERTRVYLIAKSHSRREDAMVRVTSVMRPVIRHGQLHRPFDLRQKVDKAWSATPAFRFTVEVAIHLQEGKSALCNKGGLDFPRTTHRVLHVGMAAVRFIVLQAVISWSRRCLCMATYRFMQRPIKPQSQLYRQRQLVFDASRNSAIDWTVSGCGHVICVESLRALVSGHRGIYVPTGRLCRGFG